MKISSGLSKARNIIPSRRTFRDRKLFPLFLKESIARPGTIDVLVVGVDGPSSFFVVSWLSSLIVVVAISNDLERCFPRSVLVVTDVDPSNIFVPFTDVLAILPSLILFTDKSNKFGGSGCSHCSASVVCVGEKKLITVRSPVPVFIEPLSLGPAPETGCLNNHNTF